MTDPQLELIVADPDVVLDRFLHAHALTDLSGCVVIVEPPRVRTHRPNGEEHR